MAWLDAFRWHPDSIFALQQETLKRGDGLVFDSGAPDGDEEGGAIYSINPSKQRSAQSDSCVDLKFGPGQLDFRRVKVPHHPHLLNQACCLFWSCQDPGMQAPAHGWIAWGCQASRLRRLKDTALSDEAPAAESQAQQLPACRGAWLRCSLCAGRKSGVAEQGPCAGGPGEGVLRRPEQQRKSQSARRCCPQRLRRPGERSAPTIVKLIC